MIHEAKYILSQVCIQAPVVVYSIWMKSDICCWLLDPLEQLPIPEVDVQPCGSYFAGINVQFSSNLYGYLTHEMVSTHILMINQIMERLYVRPMKCPSRQCRYFKKRIVNVMLNRGLYIVLKNHIHSIINFLSAPALLTKRRNRILY